MVRSGTRIDYEYNCLVKIEVMKQEQIMGIVRHSLSALGGWLVYKGYVDAADIEALSGVILTLIATVWSVVSK